jgi:arylsulfatase A-like enzyme
VEGEEIPAERYAHRFDDVVVPEPRTFNDDLTGRPDAVRNASMAIADLPDFRNRGCPDTLTREQRKRCNLQELVKNYYRVLLSVDENVGRVLNNLDRAGVIEDTVIIYTSDNGFFLGDHGLMPAVQQHHSRPGQGFDEPRQPVSARGLRQRLQGPV